MKLITPIMAMAPNPTRASPPTTTPATPSLLCVLDEVPVAGDVGVNVPDGLDKQELAAAFAADTEDGAARFTVPFPSKEQAIAWRLFAS
jgi:hypothetical protein